MPLIDVENYGSEDQNQLMDLIKKNDEGDIPMSELEKLNQEIEMFEKAADEALDACASARRDFVAACEEEYQPPIEE